MRVLVTGHKGYIGTVMVPMLLAEGYEVVGLDTDIFAKCAFNNGIVKIPELLMDIRDVQPEHLKGFDAVIHLAAISNDPIGNLNPEITYDINHRGTVHLAYTAKTAGCRRFLYSSSCSIYGAAAGDERLTEAASFHPVTPYGHSKILAERDLAKLASSHFSPVFLRNATAYGVSPRLRFDIVLNNLVAYAYTSGLVYMKSDGTPWRPIVHIQDITRAFLAVLAAPREVIHNQAFNVGQDNENYRIKEIAEIVQDVVPGCRIEYAPDAGPDKRTYRVSFEKIHQLLSGFQPVWNARKGAQELYEAYQQAGITRDDFEGPRYKRIDTLMGLLRSGQINADLRWHQEKILQ